ncbi:MAG: hypothetical protein LBJ58_02170, partial [Tannerellaceae bacterium]|nr:hypothetical protein [Tannerellaceae bacterium]
TLPQSTVSDLSAGDEAYIALTLREGLATGTYTATLTIDGEGIETVEVEITHVVTPVGIAAPQAPALNARAENGMLYVSGLKAGKTWSVYNLSGRLLYQSKAVGEEAVISLPVRSMYIIVSGDASVKVVNR